MKPIEKAVTLFLLCALGIMIIIGLLNSEAVAKGSELERKTIENSHPIAGVFVDIFPHQEILEQKRQEKLAQIQREQEEKIKKEQEYQNMINSIDTYINKEYVDYAFQMSKIYPNVDPYLIIALIESESSGKASVRSSGGAIGLMQIIPRWHRVRMSELGVSDLTNPYSNMLVGTHYLSELIAKYNSNNTALMCYNEGEYGGAVSRGRAGRTSSYSRKILNRMNELKK